MFKRVNLKSKKTIKKQITIMIKLPNTYEMVYNKNSTCGHCDNNNCIVHSLESVQNCTKPEMFKHSC